MIFKIITASIHYRRGLYLPMILTVSITLSLIGAAMIIGNSFQQVVNRELLKYGSNVILTPPAKPLNGDESVALALETSTIGTSEEKVATADIGQLLKLNPAWLVKGRNPQMLVGQKVADRLKVTPDSQFEINKKLWIAGILESGTEFDSYIIIDGFAEKANMILVRSKNPEQYKGENAVILREMIHSKYLFLENIRRLMLFIALISTIAAVASIINLAHLDAGTRHSEFGIMQALGASKMIVVRMIMGEYGMVSLITTFFGVLFATGLSLLILEYNTGFLPRFSWGAAGYLLLISVIAHGMAASIYLWESRGREILNEIRGN